MTRKLGQIVARNRHSYLVRVSLGRDAVTGRRRYHNRTFTGSLRAAQSYLSRRLAERERERNLEGSPVTMNQYLDRWLTLAMAPKLRAKSYRDYRSLLERYVRPQLGKRSLRGLMPLEIQAVYHQMHARGLSPRTIRYTHAVVHAALEQAVRWRMLVANPSSGAQLPPSPRCPIRVLSAEEVRRLLEHALPTRYGLVFALAVTTGLRPSEYLALQWSEIDWQRGTVNVTHTLEKGSQGHFADTKRRGSRRVVRLQAWVLQLLRTRHEEKARSHSELIFVNRSGRAINSDHLARQLKAILSRAGLPQIRLYDLRHTAATLALSAGVSAKVVAEQLGHATSAFTLDTYAHVLPHLQTEAAEAVERLLWPPEIAAASDQRKISQSVPVWNGVQKAG